MKEYYSEVVKIKSYKQKNRRKPQKKINLPVTSEFNDSDKLILMFQHDYTRLMEIKEELDNNEDYESLTVKYNDLKNEYTNLDYEVESLKETVISKDNLINDLSKEINLLKHDKEVLETKYDLMFYKMLVKFNSIVNSKLNKIRWIDRLFNKFNVTVTSEDLEVVDLLSVDNE